MTTDDVGRFIDEVDARPVILHFEGHCGCACVIHTHDYSLPPRLSALVIVRAARLKRSGSPDDAEVSVDYAYMMLDSVVGDDLVDTIIVECQLGPDDIAALLVAALRAYGLSAGNQTARTVKAPSGRSTSRNRGRS